MNAKDERHAPLSIGGPTTSDALKMSGIHGGGRRFPSQGTVVNLSAGPQNRAQRRLMARVQRRAANKGRHL